MLATLLLVGCAAPPAGPDADADAPTYAALAAAQNRRLDQLARMQAGGSVELRWTDEDGRHFEKADLDLLLELPARTALRISKLTSEDLFWLGSDPERFWYFDLLAEPTRLMTAPHGTAITAPGAGAPIALQPLVIVDLLGLTRMPDAPGDAPVVRRDDERDGWVVSLEGTGGRVQLGFAAHTRLPAWVEALDGDGAIVATSTLEEYASVSAAGTAPLDLPRFPEKITIRDAEERGSVTLFLRDQTTRVDARRFERLFDLDTLVKVLRPQRIEER